ncbi:hypothetical protein C5D07_00840 [Rathayibacter tritici]|uniref:hypothetical protein n=1 Tax=Rathayibacter tritici TaxID=33888 RepID=UPI000CE786F3|nr:hypothetical protein [Rathayibacter tritici]PPF29906.1 hypothetical protein C5C06_06115 [Rathayibacter tritici]PPI19916.1 hypothetical protein C5D07_00840 [Rathayibacter tritici]
MPLVAATLVVTACTATQPAAAPLESTATPTPEMSVGPAFVELDTSQAASRYLDLVCPNNIAINNLSEVFSAGEDDLLNGGSPDPAGVHAAASTRLDLTRRTLTLLDDSYYHWPSEVSEQLETIRSSFLAELSTLDTMANSADFRDAYYTTFPEATAEQQSAGQEVRYALGIDADTVASCVGHENGVDILTAEKEKREATT